MNYLITRIILILFLISLSPLAGITNNKTKNRENLVFYNGPDIHIEGSKILDNVSIGPEIPITGLSGFYDWQTNGDCKRQIYYFNGSILHAIYMTSTDSLQVNPSRQTRYSFSSNGGLNWDLSAIVPPGRSGYGYLTVDSGLIGPQAVIVNHYGGPVKSYIHTDAFPGLGSFTYYPSNSVRNYIWPQANLMDNRNVLVSGKTYNDNVSTDTLAVQIFRPSSGQWIGQPQFFRSGASDHFDMRIANATGPNGKAVLIMSPVYDHGGSFGANRIFYWTSNNYGVSWSGPNLMYDTQIDADGDTSKPWIGLDAVYDKVGNFFVAFNTVSLSGEYSTAKIWLNKNGVQNKILVKNSQITGAMTSAVGTHMEDVCSMDWPSISLSEYSDAVFCAYSVAKQNDTVNGFNSMDIYISYANAGNLSPSNNRIQITNGTDDERFVSLNRISFGDFNRKIPAVYQKDPQPGTSAPDHNDNAPLSRSSLIYREIELTVPLLNIINNLSEQIPESYKLQQNFPNPFNPSTNIRFDIPKSGNVRILIYDISGKLVETLIDESLSPGTYEINWNGDRFASGVYFYNLEAEGFNQTRKMLLIK
ncbi:MAG: T9SS type A sorting domain-containing protein [Ignavibacteriae bacterium]|nr:T9SS type A sorting domain-containing protein [Ignavibacteriota bacterium]MCB9244391.1 T9SS type A sorting domain-containing protein [Ignavibacteriales bacterium]